MKNVFSVEFFTKKSGQKGSVTIFLTMILVPMLLLMITLTDYAKVSVAKRQVSGAGDLALNAGLSYYDKTLQDMYGIFAVSKDVGALEDNLEKYFENILLGEGIDTTDPFISKIVNIITGSKNSEDAYMNLINLTSTEFELSGIEEANLSNATLLNNQIMDYMKYRGPMVLAGGLLDKIGMFKGVNKEMKAVQKKAEFEEELDKAGDKCATAYQKIKAYNERIKEYNFNADRVQQFEQEIKELYKRIITGIFLVSQNDNTKPKESKKSDKDYSSYRIDDLKGILAEAFKDNSNYRKRCNEHMSFGGDTAEYVYTAKYLYSYNDLAAYFDENIRGAGDEFLKRLQNFEESMQDDTELFDAAKKIEDYINDKNKKDGGFDLENLKYLRKHGDHSEELKNYIRILEDFLRDFQTNTEKDNDWYIKEIQQYAEDYYELSGDYEDSSIKEEIISDVTELKKRWKAYEKRYNELQDELSGYNKWKEEYNKNLDYFREGKTGSLYDAAAVKRNAAIALIESDITKAKEKKDAIDDGIDQIKKAAKAAKKVMENVIAAFNTLEEQRNAWQGQIDTLSGESKSSMQADLNSEAGNIDKEQALKCKENLEEICGMLEELEKDIAQFKFKKSDVEKAAKDCADKNIDVRKNAADYYYDAAYGGLSIDINHVPKEIDRENDKFFGYLEKLYGENGNDNYQRKVNDDDEMEKEVREDKKEQEETKKELLKINSDAENSDLAGGDVNIKKKYGSPALPSVEKAVQNEVERHIGVDSKNISKSIEKATNSSIIDNIMSFSVEGCVEDVYLTEYVMNLFTYRTYNKNPDGSVISDAGLKTLSNCNYIAGDLKGAEAEYVLWGLDTKKANLNATYSVIFGIRFLMNTVYAFMDSEVRAETLAAATAIAGWTGFGVPIVKTAFTVGLALLESKLDMGALIHGRSVPVYKDKNTWTSSLSGFAKNTSSELIAAATKKAQDAAEAAIDKIHDCAAENIKELSDDMTKGLQNMTRDTITTVVDNVTSAIKNKIMGIFDYGVDYASMKKEEINEEITKWTEELKDTLGVPDSEPPIENVTDYLLYKAYHEVIHTSGFVIFVTDEIWNNYKDAKTKDVQNLMKELEEKVYNVCKIKKISKDGKEEIIEVFGINTDNLIKDAISTVNASVQKCLDEKSEAAKEKISSFISDYGQKLQNSAHTKPVSGAASKTNITSKSWASSVTMDYSEYLTMMLLVTGALENGYNKHLLRTADLIQINTGIAKQEDGTFALKNCKTHLQVHAVVRGSTFFAGTEYLKKTDNIYLKQSNGLYGVTYNGVDGY